MQPIVTKIIKMLDDERIERRCAAAMVLGELGLREKAIVSRLLTSLADDHPTLQLYVLDALAALRARKIASHVAPLLDSGDEQVRARATALLAEQKGGAALDLARELDHGAPSRRREIIKLVARQHDERTFGRLLELLADPDVGEVAMLTLRAELDRMSEASRQQLQAMLLARLKNRAVMSDLQGAARTVRLLGYLRDGKLVATLLPFAGQKHPTVIRLAALAALRRPLRAARSTTKPAMTLLDFLDDADPTVARAALETVRQCELPDQAVARLTKMVASPHAEVRAFAVHAIARTGKDAALKTVIESLGTTDPAVRDAAASALRELDGVSSKLLSQLRDARDDADLCERVVRLLLPRARDLKPAERRSIVEMALDALEGARAGAPHLSRLARAADPEVYASLLAQRAAKHRRAKRHDQALQLFNQLDQAHLLQEDARYAALISGLQTTQSKKDLARVARTTSPVLKHAVQLLEDGFPLAKRLVRESSITPDDLFFVGFNFVESTDEDHQDLGRALLTHIATKSPRSKLGRSAKNKLRLVS